ncbi:hybrid sensor histidine kinase/response regulator [Paraliomyxa miuraensis]|uniref:hybrid sensor histidine kinase/response regulator n=1 Tax=Paraliomyxa miuraensis TaxID=376150 RepID=UPI002253D000|nr:PAS domain S-box protein [Paraliomyxa miuraensis]MCX4243890.1 PAS domain S-box protein [Paraliomyxa miuraensis]
MSHERSHTVGGRSALPAGFDLLAVIEHATDAIGFDDADGNVVYANRAYRRLFGIDDDATDLGRLEDHAAEGWGHELVRRHDERARGQLGASSYAYRARRRDGVEFWAEVSVVPIFEGGHFWGTHAVVRDVNEQHEREAALRAENQALSAAIGAIPLAVVVLDREGRVQAWNDATTQGFGWTRDEAQGRPYPLVPAEQWSEFIGSLHRVLREGTLEGLESVRRRRDGTEVEVALWSRALAGETARDGRVLEVIVDISKQRRAQQDYRQLFERAFDAIVVFEPESERVLDVNARACELYGLSRDEFVGMNLQTMTQDVPRGRVVLDRIQRDGTLHNYETVQRHKDGTELLVECNASIVEYQGRPAVLSINRDLSERRRLQRELTHVQRMKAVGQLAAGVAHEFNNVLAAILGTAESLLDLVEGSDARERLQQMIARAETGSRLTRQLLGFSRGGSEERAPIEVDQHIRGMTKWLARLLGKDVELRLETRAPGMVVIIDPTQLEQVVLNLSVNARDAMPRGGSLRIHTRALRLVAAREATTGTIEPGTYVAMEFRDSGPGVSQQAQEHLFEPFFSTKDRGKGTGLGLATVYTIVDGLGGAIDLRNAVDPGGACFTIVLPAIERESELVVPSPPERPRGGRETILVVDDEPTIQTALSQMLRGMGYHVLTAPDANRARRVFEDAGGAVDLLLTDVSMPGGSGVDLAKDLLDRSPTLKVLVMSGYLDEASSRALPRTSFVDKPFTRTIISQRIREMLGD